MGQQPVLALHAAGIAGQRAVLANDPVTGNDHGYPVRADGRPHRAHGIGTPETFGHGLIVGGVAKRNRAQFSPDPSLEIGARGVQGDVESMTGALEVFGNFAGSLARVFVFAQYGACPQALLQVAAFALDPFGTGKFEQADALVRGADVHGAKRRGKALAADEGHGVSPGFVAGCPQVLASVTDPSRETFRGQLIHPDPGANALADFCSVLLWCSGSWTCYHQQLDLTASSGWAQTLSNNSPVHDAMELSS